MTDAERVADAVADVFGLRSVRVELVPLSAGASRETYLVHASADGWSRELVLQKDRGGGLVGVAEQARLLAAVAASGVPVPAVHSWDATGDRLGTPFLLTGHVAGETLPRRILRSPELAAARAGFAAQAGRVLARLHATPVTGLSWLDPADQLDHVVDWLDEMDAALPAFEIAIGWLRRNRPAPVEHVLVHGDFRTGNLIIGEDGIRAVLDWELAHLGDPAEDLAWLCLKPWRFRGPGIVGGMGDLDDLLDAYAAATGRSIEPARLFWWQVLGTLKWGVVCRRQAWTHQSGTHRSVELAAIGRRVCENEYDLLRMLP